MPSTKILLADSSQNLAINLKARLEAYGLAVELAGSLSALEALPAGEFVLAIADEKLSGSEKFEHLEWLKKARIPVFLWTDQEAMAGDEALREAHGVQKLFRKLNRADLLMATEEFMQGVKGHAESPKAFLIVEDSATVRNYVRKVLLDAFPASHVSEAEDGKTAISAMKWGKVDLIITDLHMEGMDGSKFVQVLRHNNVLSKKPILILSGMITPEVREEMSALPRLRLVPKPASPEALVQAVRELLNDAKAAP